ncbi:MAG: DNA-formamidopyrimidine glycosylase [Candidatus Paceibacterota bacterium]
MPELPEVETIVRGLNKKVRGLKITNAWTDWAKTIKTHSLKAFVSEIKGRKILRAHRRAKYIMLDLSGGKTIIIHQKISGHLLYGKWRVSGKKVTPAIEGPIKDDPYNKYIRFIIYLDNGYMLGLSDVRRFGKVFLGDTDDVESINEIGRLGPEPLEKGFTVKKFKELIKRRKGLIKKVLMDPFVIAGIGNIYSDEILWYAGIHPEKRVEKLKDKELEEIYRALVKVLRKAIDAKGDSQQDYRTLEGTFGNYQNMQKAYQRTDEKCQKKDGGAIKRIVINNRSAHFCPVHQKK